MNFCLELLALFWTMCVRSMRCLRAYQAVWHSVNKVDCELTTSTIAEAPRFRLSAARERIRRVDGAVNPRVQSFFDADPVTH